MFILMTVMDILIKVNLEEFSKFQKGCGLVNKDLQYPQNLLNVNHLKFILLNVINPKLYCLSNIVSYNSQ